MSKFTYVGLNASTVYVGENSVPVAPGDEVDLSEEDQNSDDNQPMIESGLLQKVATKTTSKAKKEVESK
jgi:hypothetical protein